MVSSIKFAQIIASLTERLGKLIIPTDGIPFVAVVGNTPIYAGAIYNNLSSRSFAGITMIRPEPNRPEIWQINLGYPGEKDFSGKDLRSDSRILKALESKHKLYEDLEIVGRCSEIKLSGKHMPTARFTFQILSITKGAFAAQEVAFELNTFSGREGARLLAILNTKNSRDGQLEFDKKKRLILRAEQNLSSSAPDFNKLIFRDFSAFGGRSSDRRRR